MFILVTLNTVHARVAQFLDYFLVLRGIDHMSQLTGLLIGIVL